jgi:uncharacterized protein (UPF0332 family)
MPENLDRILHDCFKLEKGKKPMLRKIKPKKDNVLAHLKKAHNNLRAMKLMFENEFFDWTVICGYYAMYHSVQASLYYIGIRAYSHFCAIAAFQKFYIEKGKVKKDYIGYLQRAKQLEKEYIRTLGEARENRIRVQYGTQILTNDDAEWIIEDAEDFVLKIEELLTEEV